MHLKKKLAAAAVVAAMAAGVIYGSTLEMSGVEEESRLSWFGGKETIYFWYSDDTLSNYINSAAVAFGEQEGVRVIPVLTSDGEYLEAINQASLHTDRIPDGYLISHDSLEKAYLAGLASPIEDVEGICNEEHFPEAALAAVSYQDKLIGYPLFYETNALIYNETYLEEWARQQAQAELSGGEEEFIPEGEQTDAVQGQPAVFTEEELAAKTQEYLVQAIPSTVDDILNIADTFDVPEGVEGVMKWDVSDIFYNYWIIGSYMIVGGDAGDDAEQIQINNPETIQCLEVYKALNQFFFIESDTVDYESVVEDFIQGKIVFTIGTTDIVDRLEQAKADGSMAWDYGITTMPDVSGELQSRSMSVTNAVIVNGYSPNKELANRFAAFLTEEYVGELYERTGKAAANYNADQDNGALQMFRQEYAGSVPLPKMMDTGNFWLQLEILFSRVWNGEDVTTLVGELAAQMDTQTGKAPAPE